MGIIESVIGRVVHNFLMPKSVPAWYTERTCLPEAHSDSLLLLGHVTLNVRDLEAARRFYVDTLGFEEASCDGKESRLLAGLSEIRLRKSTDAKAWPGRLYIWVDDSKAMFERCQAFQNEIGSEVVEGVHHVTSRDSADALELRDMDGNDLLVNKAPRGFDDRLRRMLRKGESSVSKVLAVVEALHYVPPGVALQVARFYKQLLGAAVSTKDDGYAVHFTPSKTFRQTLAFVDDEDEVISMESSHEVCVYLPTEEKFKAAFEKCAEAGILSEGAPQQWAAALEAREFRISQCFDPQSEASALEIETTLRLPAHTECRLATAGSSPAPVTTAEGGKESQ